jgi:hypothetical protein
MDRRIEKCIQKPERSYHLEGLGVDGRKSAIKMVLKEIGCEVVEWIHLWWALVNTIMNPRVL